MKKYISAAFVCFLFLLNMQAGDRVKLLCRPCPQDSILLRWAPADRQTWVLGNQYGYVVERYTILREGNLLEEKERVLLTPVPLKPFPLEAWEPYEEDRYVSTAAECIFGETESLPLVSPGAIARRYRQEQNRFSFALYAADQSVLAARLSGLYLVDNKAVANEKYLYTVHIATPDSIPADTAFAFTGLSEYQVLPKPIDLAARWTDKKVELSWNILYLNHIYNSYILEKSMDGRRYSAVSDNAGVQAADKDVVPEYAYRTDSLPDNQTVWYYRVRGINAFGETGPPSDSIFGHGRIPITYAPVITNKEVLNNKEVRLTWNYPEDRNESVSGFRIYRSDSPNGIKARIFETKRPSERQFTDHQPDITNYYTISVFDDETEKVSPASTYAELVDSIPPVAPTGLAGKIDTLGIVRLAWKPNPDRDIKGYRVYRSNHPDAEFILVSPAMVADTVFTDSINIHTLTKEIFYCLRAEDLRLNQSEFSRILELKRPDVIPPVMPVIQSVEIQKNGLQITWLNSSSTDVVSHHIYRKAENDTVFQLLASIKKSNDTRTTYPDNSVQTGETYIYRIQAEDDSGLRSEFSIPVQQKAPGEIKEEIVLKKEADFEKITLIWTIRSKKKVERVLIYKAIDNEPIKLYNNSTENKYIDKEVALEKTYRYRIKAIYADGSSSELSNEVTVKM